MKKFKLENYIFHMEEYHSNLIHGNDQDSIIEMIMMDGEIDHIYEEVSYKSFKSTRGGKWLVEYADPSYPHCLNKSEAILTYKDFLSEGLGLNEDFWIYKQLNKKEKTKIEKEVRLFFDKEVGRKIEKERQDRYKLYLKLKKEFEK